jgi:Transposase DDE domain
MELTNFACRRNFMHDPAACYQMNAMIERHLPHLRPAERAGLVLWLRGAIMAKSACEGAVVTALAAIWGHEDAIRQRLREWLRDGADKLVPCQTQLNVSHCFVPLLRWVLTLWQGTELALAIDVTYHQDTLMVIVISVLYRGCAIPVAWKTLRGHAKGAWMPIICALLAQLQEAVPPEMTVVVLADAGLRSGNLWRAIHELGWCPLLRLHLTDTFRPAGWRQRHPVRTLVSEAGHAWIGTGKAFSKNPLAGTVIVIWQEGVEEPWALLTAGAPEKVGIWWYSLRMWIELGFRALKGVGWHWDRTRRTDPERAARHWLVLAVAMIWVLAAGTRVEEALDRAMPPAHLHVPPRSTTPPVPRVRLVSVFAYGLAALAHQVHRGTLWTCLWLTPEAWPKPPPSLQLTYHQAA